MNHQALAALNSKSVIVEVRRAEDEAKPQSKAEVDELQSFVGKKANQRWLWHAIDHYSGQILAYVLGSYQFAY